MQAWRIPANAVNTGTGTHQYRYRTYLQGFGSGIRVFSPIQIRVLKVQLRVLKVRIRISPFINLPACDLNYGFDKVLEEPDCLTKKDSVKSALYEIYGNIFIYFYPCFRRFFHGSGYGFFRIGSGFFVDPDPDSKKSLIRIREKTRIRNTAYLSLLNHMDVCRSLVAHLAAVAATRVQILACCQIGTVLYIKYLKNTGTENGTQGTKRVRNKIKYGSDRIRKSGIGTMCNLVLGYRFTAN